MGFRTSPLFIAITRTHLAGIFISEHVIQLNIYIGILSTKDVRLSHKQQNQCTRKNEEDKGEDKMAYALFLSIVLYENN